MFQTFRKHQQPIMIVTTTIIVIAFVWLYNGTSVDMGSGSQPSYKVYGRTVTQLQVERAARRFQVAASLEMGPLLNGLAGRATTREQALENFVWNSFILDHEARRLGISATDTEVMEVIKALPVFLTNGQFDPMKYQGAVQNFLAPNGFTETQLEELVRDQIRLEKLVALVGSGVDFTPGEFRAVYTENFQKMKVEVVDFKLADFTAGVSPSEEAVAKYFEDHKPQLNTEEKRVVSWVRIGLNEEEQKLTGRERVAALQKQSDLATAFSQDRLGGAAFTELAAKHGLKVENSGEFTLSQPPAALGQKGAVAFQLTEENRDSDAIGDENGFTLLYLEQIIPPRPLTLEEARGRIVEALKQEEGLKAMNARATEVRAKLLEALGKGTPFAEAATAAGVKAESLPAFSLAEPSAQSLVRPELAETAVDLAQGGLSELTRTSEGGSLVYLEKREPVDDAKLAETQKEQLGRLREMKQLAAFNDWLVQRNKEANIRSFKAALNNNSNLDLE